MEKLTMTNLCAEERPINFDQMVGQRELVENIRSQAKKDKFFQCYILEGQFGSGKTTMARIIARAINCEHRDENGNPCGECPSCKAMSHGSLDVIELDAASNTGVDSIRALKESVGYLPSELSKKVYIIDEVHKLSDGAFNALLKVLEEPPTHVVFILCTTEMKKIPATIRSRAACYHYQRIAVTDIAEHLKNLSEKYGFSYTEEGLMLIARNASGSMRNALKLLEQASQEEEGITENAVASMLGLVSPVELFALLKVLAKRETAAAIQKSQEQLKKGRDVVALVRDLMEISSDCVLASVADISAINNTEQYVALVRETISDFSEDTFCSITEGLMDINQDLRKGAEDTTLICGIIKMSHSDNAKMERLEQRVMELENRLSQGNFSTIQQTIPNTVQVVEPVTASTKLEAEDVPTPIKEESVHSEVPFMELPEEPDEDDISMDGFVPVIADENIPFISFAEAEDIATVAETSPCVSDMESTVEEDVQTQAVDKSAEPTPIQELEPVKAPTMDAFSLFNMFGFGKSSEKTEKKTEEVKQETTMEKAESVSEEARVIEEVSEEPRQTDSVIKELPFAPQGPFNESDKMELPAEISASIEGDTDEFLDDLADGDLVAENLFGLCMQRQETEHGTQFITDDSVFLRMANVYHDRTGGFPFGVKMAAGQK